MKLIDKDALLAKINKRIMDAPIDCYGHQRVWAYNDVKDILDTLEVKEVDLKQPYREYINKTYIEEFAQSILDGNIKGDLDSSDLFGIMSYGFELGIKAAQKGEEV